MNCLRIKKILRKRNLKTFMVVAEKPITLKLLIMNVSSVVKLVVKWQLMVQIEVKSFSTLLAKSFVN